MEERILDYTLVPGGLLFMVGYHVWLLFRFLKHPSTTVIGLNSLSRRYWVRAMMEDSSKNGVLSVQTLRNNIMASSAVASGCIMLSSAMAVLMSGKYGDRSLGLVFGDKTALAISIKCSAVLLCFLLSFLLNVQSIRYFSLASLLINVPSSSLKKTMMMMMMRPPLPHPAEEQHSPHHGDDLSRVVVVEYVGSIVNRGSYFWSLGLRAFYFAFPLFLWIFGPIPMFLSSIVLVLMLSSVDLISSYQSAAPLGLHHDIHPAVQSDLV